MEVPTLDGRVNLKIPKETQTGKVFRLRGKGVTQVRGGGVGDLLCKVQIETPVELTQQQKELLEKFKESLGENENTLQRKDRGSVVLKAFLKVFKSDLGIIICYV